MTKTQTNKNVQYKFSNSGTKIIRPILLTRLEHLVTIFEVNTKQTKNLFNFKNFKPQYRPTSLFCYTFRYFLYILYEFMYNFFSFLSFFIQLQPLLLRFSAAQITLQPSRSQRRSLFQQQHVSKMFPPTLPNRPLLRHNRDDCTA